MPAWQLDKWVVYWDRDTGGRGHLGSVCAALSWCAMLLKHISASNVDDGPPPLLLPIWLYGTQASHALQSLIGTHYLMLRPSCAPWVSAPVYISVSFPVHYIVNCWVWTPSSACDHVMYHSIHVIRLLETACIYVHGLRSHSELTSLCTLEMLHT